MAEYVKLSDYELQSKTDEFRKRLKQGETLDDILVEAYATAREACSRVIGERPYSSAITSLSKEQGGDTSFGWLERITNQLKTTPSSFELLRKQYKLR